MKKGNEIGTEAYLRAVPLPQYADTYTVIPHGAVIDKIEKELGDCGFKIESTSYSYSYGGEIAQGRVHIQSKKDSDMGMLFTWVNSYNKKVKFSCAIGGFIYDNKASFVGTEGLSWVRKHMGDADEEAYSIIEQLIENANEYFDKIIKEKERMKAAPLNIEDYGCIMGSLYFEHELITPSQASEIRHERKKPVYQYTDKNTLWGLYKLLMYGIDNMSLIKWQASQQKLHHLIMAEYAIAKDQMVKKPDMMEEPLASNELKETETPTEKKTCNTTESEDDQEEFEQAKDQEVNEAEEENLSIEIDDISHLETSDFVTDEEEDALMEAALTPVSDPVEVSEEVIDMIKEDHGVNQSNQYEVDPEVDPKVGVTEDVVDDVDLFNDSLFPTSDTQEEINIFNSKSDQVPEKEPEEKEKEENFLEIEAHQSVTIPTESIVKTGLIEKKMAELYGSVPSYEVDETQKQINVTINKTQESFYIIKHEE
tara:strand:- start:990 stop:2432 length:1443 start_codon:yes stop_codon:yes gene_type:complete